MFNKTFMKVIAAAVVVIFYPWLSFSSTRDWSIYVTVSAGSLIRIRQLDIDYGYLEYATDAANAYQDQ